MPPRVEFLYTLTPGGAYQPPTYDQRHVCNGGSTNMSSSQSLPNGNMFVCMALSGLLYEVNPAGTTIWTKQVSGQVSKAYRYNACYVNNQAPPIPEITTVGNQLVSTEAVTYQWFRNGDLIEGATERIFIPSEPGMYLVRITDENGCFFQYSSMVAVTVVNLVINAVANISKYGDVSGDGHFMPGDEVTLTATPRPFCQFLSWTEDDVVVSTVPVYIFTASHDRNLVANFAVRTFSIANDQDPADGGSNWIPAPETGQLSEIGSETVDEIIIFPNPTQGKLHVLPEIAERIEVFNMNGESLTEFLQISTLNFSKFESGTYFLRIHTPQNIFLKKVIVLR
jgi:hypothetical protein